MIDINFAQKSFKEYLKNFDSNNEKIALKIRHTYNVIDSSRYIANELKLNEENAKLAELIALLHDIGRFEQLKKFDSYNDFEEMDHAEAGIKLLFETKEDGKLFIRKFVEEEKYDRIIYKAIKNHNKYEIESNLDEIENLHAKLIRDSDKIDNFRVKEKESTEALFGISMEEFEKEKISDFIFEDYKKEKLVDSRTVVTHMDMWVSYLAFLFDFNFKESIEYVKNKNYVNINIDRIHYKDKDTFSKMQEIRKISNEYIEKRLK